MNAKPEFSYEENSLLDHELEKKIFRKHTKRTGSYLLCLHVSFTILYIFIAGLLIHRLSPRTPGYPTAKITKELVSFETQFFDVDVGHNSPYTGPPSYAIDLAWHNLFENANLRVTADELKSMNKTSVSLADGDGYMANLDIHHQLHCLKFLRWYIYPEYYDFRLNATSTRHAGTYVFPKKSRKAANKYRWQDHCIENLRRNIMCLPSLEIMTFDWIQNNEHPQPHFSYEHKCVNWDNINAWTAERAFDYFDPTLLINPIYDPNLEPGGD